MLMIHTYFLLERTRRQGLFYGWREVDNSDLVWTAGGCSSLPCQRTPVGRVGEYLNIVCTYIVISDYTLILSNKNVVWCKMHLGPNGLFLYDLKEVNCKEAFNQEGGIKPPHT